MLFVVALLVGIAVSFALNRMNRSGTQHMMLGGLCILTGGILSLNPAISGTGEASVVMVGLTYFGFVLGVLGFFFKKSDS